MKRTRIVLAGMPRMMLEFIETILAPYADLSVVGHVPADGNLSVAMRRYRADVLIFMQPDGNGSEISVHRMFWCHPSKVLAIAKGGRTGVLYDLRPYATALGEMSADGLADAIRSAGPI